MKFKISSLGCRLNQSEIESVSTKLQEKGHVPTSGNDADVYIINSCSVTQRSERKTRNLLYRAQAALDDKKGGRIILAGCMAERCLRDGRVYYVPNDYKYLIPDLVDNPDLIEDMDRQVKSRFMFSAPVKSSVNRVNLKIQDGCDNFCSYCIIPMVRGKPQSRPHDDVIGEFRELVDSGYKEIILTGVMIGQYQSGGMDLADLTGELLSMKGSFRIHLTSMTPIYVNRKLLDLLTHEKLVKHLHLSLQSGSNAVLASMNRPYTREGYRALAESIRERVPDFNFTTDIIVGFPGEGDRDFQDSLDLVAEVGFSHVHTFRYSPRPGTRAAGMDETVSEAEKTERSRKVIKLYTKQKADYYRRFDNRDSTFLSERFKRGVTTGFNEYYVPVEVEGRLPRNEFFTVTTVFDPSRICCSGRVR